MSYIHKIAMLQKEYEVLRGQLVDELKQHPNGWRVWIPANLCNWRDYDAVEIIRLFPPVSVVVKKIQGLDRQHEQEDKNAEANGYY